MEPDDELRFTQSIGRWEAALAVFQAMVARDPKLATVQMKNHTRMGGTVHLPLHRPEGWDKETWAAVEEHVKNLEKRFPGLVLLPEQV